MEEPFFFSPRNEYRFFMSCGFTFVIGRGFLSFFLSFFVLYLAQEYNQPLNATTSDAPVPPALSEWGLCYESSGGIIL